jgi:redox-sensitive bicupin YhaK (pirin superfamily)
MIRIRKANERGHADHGWLDTRHTFSFADYHDPAHMGFRALRVINEDRVRPGQGFGMHGHRDMEIISYVLEGSLAHRDSLGTGSVLGPGELQRITAGTGVRHSEFNPSATELVHFYQIWLLPERAGLTPGYEQRAFPSQGKLGKLQLVASPDGADGSLTIRQDARLYLAALGKGDSVAHTLVPGRHAWLQITRGDVRLDSQTLTAGDGAAISNQSQLTVAGASDSEVLLFDLA